jgi:hypothetical protein
MDVEPKFRERWMKQKGNDVIKNSPEEVFETDYFLVIMDRALMAFST